MHFSMKISSSQKFRASLYAAEKCTAYIHTDTASVRPKPNFGSGNRNQGIGIGAETFFPKLKLFFSFFPQIVKFSHVFPLKCGFSIGYGIGRKYRPMWVSVSDLNQNGDFGHTLDTAQRL